MSHRKLAYDPISGKASLFMMSDDEEVLAQMQALNTPVGHTVIDAPNIDSAVGVTVDVTGAVPVINTATPTQNVKTLAEVKESRRAEIEHARNLAALANVTAHGTQWQADERSQRLLANAITLASAGLPLPPFWRDANNVNKPITSLNDLLVIAAAMATQTQTAYSKSWTKKAEVSAATSVAQVDAITPT